MSSGSDSDEDFVPGEPEQVSEEGSADEETDMQYEKELDHKAKKRKAAQESKGKKKRKATRSSRGGKNKEPTPEPEEEKPDPEPVLDPEEEKKREDDLWAKFLEGTETKPKPVANETNNTVTNSTLVGTNEKSQARKANVKEGKDDEKARERRIFEFAGETIVVENNVIKEKIKSDSPAAASKLAAAPSRGAGGLSSVLGQLNKKNQLSTLEKTKLDWETYKKEEGIEEEVQSHNKGKGGYLERKDFLERADVRTYEIERDLRMSRRSNR